MTPDQTGESPRELDLDRIYELLCYFCLIAALRQGREIALTHHEADGPHGYRFPYGPAHKQNFAYFRLEYEGRVYDLCCGTGLPVPEGPDEHPDISLQEMNGLSAPSTPGKPTAIWDAKYHSDFVAKSDVQQMNWWCDIFKEQLLNYEDEDLLERLFPEPFQVCAVITNVQEGGMALNSQQLLRNGFSVVFSYHGTSGNQEPKPTRPQHLEYRRQQNKE